MTANQLAYASNQIEQKKADELARHNESVEAETYRSNKASEDLKARDQEIKEREISEVERHNAEMESIQKEYNSLYLKLQKSQGDERNRIQAELANIERLKTDEVLRHNEEMEDIEQDKNWLQANYQEEAARHNVALEQLETELNRIKESENTIKQKYNEMQSVYWSGQLAAEQARVTVDELKAQNALYLGQLNALNDLYANSQKILEYKESGKPESESRIWKNYIEGVTNALRNVGGTILGALTSFGH